MGGETWEVRNLWRTFPVPSLPSSWQEPFEGSDSLLAPGSSAASSASGLPSTHLALSLLKVTPCSLQLLMNSYHFTVCMREMGKTKVVLVITSHTLIFHISNII